MPLPHNFADLYREAPVFAACGAVYFACDIFLPNEGWPALLRPLFLVLLLIPCACYLWRTRRHDRLSWRYQYPRLCVAAAGTAAIIMAAPVCLDLIGGSQNLSTRDFHIRESMPDRDSSGGFRLVLPAIRQDFPIDNRHYHPLNRATETRIAYWPQSGIIQRIDILQSR